MVQPIADEVLSVRQIAVVAGFAMPPSREASRHSIAIQVLQRMASETGTGATPIRTRRFVKAHSGPVVPVTGIVVEPSVRTGRIIDQPKTEFRGHRAAEVAGGRINTGEAFARQGMLGDAQGWWGPVARQMGGARARSGGGTRPF